MPGGQGRFRFLPLGPLATPVTPLKRSLREGVRHCTPCLYRTKRLPVEGGGFCEAKDGRSASRLLFVYLNPSVSLHSTAPRPGRLLGCCINTACRAVPLRGAIVSMRLRGSPGGLRGEIEIFHGPWQKSSLSRPWQQLSRSFAKVAQHKHERSCYEQPQCGKAC